MSIQVLLLDRDGVDTGCPVSRPGARQPRSSLVPVVVEFWLAETVDGPVGGSISIDPEVDHWFHVAMTWDGEEARLYRDGEVVLSRALQVVVYDDHVARIGADNDFGQDVNFFPGAIDEVQIYQRALSSDEVAELATH
jgi:hypothetical protein